MSSKLPPERKLELVDEISAGLMLTDNTVMPIRVEGKLKLVARNILKESDEDLLLMDKVMAIAILSQVHEIKKYVEEGD